MAAGFSIETKNISIFTKEINKISDKLLTDEILERKLKIDMEIKFSDISRDLYENLLAFEPVGLGNPGPTFVSRKVEVIEARAVGRESKHLKLKLKQNEHIFDAIYFSGGEIYSKLALDKKVDVVYRLKENLWNGRSSLQLIVRDIGT